MNDRPSSSSPRLDKPSISTLARQIAETNRDHDSDDWTWPEDASADASDARDAMALFDQDGCVLGWNREAWLMLGYSAAETVGRPLRQVLGLRETDPVVIEGLGDFLASRMTQREAGLPRSIVATHRTGKEMPLQLALAAVPGTADPAVGLAVLRARGTEARALTRHAGVDWTRKLFDATPALILVRDASGAVRNINDGACRLLQFSREAIIGRNWIDALVPPSEQAAEHDLFKGLLLDDYRKPVERRGHLLTHDATRSMLWRHNVIRNDQGFVSAVVTVGFALEVPCEVPTLSPVERSLASLIQNSFVGVLVLDEQGEILFANAAAQRQLNQSAESLLGAPFGIPAIDRRTELSILRRDGGIGTAEVNVSHSEWNNQPAFLVSLYDVTEHKETARQMQRLALHDPLTGTPNRRALVHHLQSAIQRAATEDRRLALAFLDLDDFKSVNDQFGHAVGDRLLCACAARLKEGLRGSDGVFRLGGDEFVVIIEGLSAPLDVKPVLEKLREACARAVPIGERRFALSFSVGLALYPDDADYGDLLLQVADEAMYVAKAHKAENAFHCRGMALQSLCKEFLNHEQLADAPLGKQPDAATHG